MFRQALDYVAAIGGAAAGLIVYTASYGWLNLAAGLCLVPVALGLVRFLSSQQNRRRVGGGIRTPVR